MMKSKLERRDVLKGLIAISTAGALAACGSGNDTGSGAAATTDITFASEGAFFSSEELAFLSAVAQTIIPQTDTAGAVEAGVPAVLQDLASDWGNDDFRRYWRKGTQDLRTEFKIQAGQDFENMSAAQQQNLLARYDAKVYDGTIDNGFYRDIKATIVRAYYMSEPGATEELAYEAVPGDWKGCVPLSEYPRAWAT
jgi:hypothetical protein